MISFLEKYNNHVYELSGVLIVLIWMSFSWNSDPTDPSAGSIKISDETDTSTKGIFVEEKGVVFCSADNKINFKVIHQQDYRIPCDPDPSTPAGIRYFILTENPDNFSVQDLSALETLPVYKNNGEAVVLGSGTANDLEITETFLESIGLERPYEIWIVPFISHNTLSSSFLGHFESDQDCFDVRLETAVALTALRKIQIMARQTSSPGGELEFNYNEVWGQGGWPELYPLQNYRFYAIDESNGDTLKITDEYDGKRRFRPATPSGRLHLLVIDSLGCESGGFSGWRYTQPQIKIFSAEDFARPGDSRCLPVFADHIFDLNEISIKMDWNPEELEWEEIIRLHPLFDQGVVRIDTSRIDQGEIIFAWENDELRDFKLVPESLLFELCFKVLADPGTKAEISFVDSETFFDNGYFQNEWEGTAGSVTVGTDGWNVVRDYRYCYTDTDVTDITFYTLGSYPPYTFEIPELGLSKSEIYTNEIHLTDLPAGTYSYRLTDSLGGTHYAPDAIRIPSGTPAGLAVEDFFPPNCNDNDGWIKLKIPETDYSRIHVSGPDTDEFFTSKILYEDLAPGKYILTPYDVHDCPGRPLTIDLNQKPILDISVKLVSASCDSETTEVEISAFDGKGDPVNTSLLLNGNQWVSSNTPLKMIPGVYRLEVNDSDFCKVDTEITIPENPVSENGVSLHAPVRVREKDTFTVYAEDLQMDSIISFRWSPSEKVVKQKSDEATFSLDSSSWIVLTVTDPRGCEFSDSVYVEMISSPDEGEEEDPKKEECIVSLPNAIVPNGENHTLRVYATCEIGVQEIRIYDRWGGQRYAGQEEEVGYEVWERLAPDVYLVEVIYEQAGKGVRKMTESVMVIR